MYVEFCKGIGIVSKQEHAWGFITTHSSTSIALISVKMKVLQLEIQNFTTILFWDAFTIEMYNFFFQICIVVHE
jgi:hypothetical protein